jgi:hypothetical protein
MKKSKAGRKKSKAGTKAGEKVDFWIFLAGSKKSWSFFAQFSLSTLSGSTFVANHMRSACASARAREERQILTNRSRVSFARVLARGARGPAQVGSTRDRRSMYICDTRRRPRRAAGSVEHAAF